MNKHFAILPDGVKATRNSQNRTYTHAIAVSPLAADVAIEEFQERFKQIAQWAFDSLETLNAIKAEGLTAGVRTSFGREYAEFTVNGEVIHLDDIYAAGTITVEEATAQAITTYTERIKRCDQRCDDIMAEIEKIKVDGKLGEWGIVTWCGRYDLAVTQLSKWSQRRGYTAHIVEVERVGA